MSLFSKINVCLILIAMVFALAPTTSYAAAYIKFDGISAKKMPRMRVTDKTTVHEVAVFVARHTGVNVDCINLSWRGRDLWGPIKDGEGQAKHRGQRRTEGWRWEETDGLEQRTLGSYSLTSNADVLDFSLSFTGCVPCFGGCC